MSDFAKNNEMCNCSATCKAKIGKGDHEITAIVDLHKMNSEDDNYNFAKVRFQSGSTYFKKVHSDLDRIYLDDKERVKQIMVVDHGNHQYKQELEIQALTLKPPKAQAGGNGEVILYCRLTDSFGESKSEQVLTYKIAEWNGVTSLCHEDEQDIERKCCTKNLGKKIEVRPKIIKEKKADSYNCVRIDFFLKHNNEYLVRSYKVGERKEDPIFLFNQHREEKELDFYTILNNEEEIIIEIWNVELFLPQTDCFGKVVMNGRYKEFFDSPNSEWEWKAFKNMEIARWNLDGDECSDNQMEK